MLNFFVTVFLGGGGCLFVFEIPNMFIVLKKDSTLFKQHRQFSPETEGGNYCFLSGALFILLL